jgi:hypothetical protein
MKKRLAIVALVVLVGVLVGRVVSPSIRSWENGKFTFEVSGTEGTEFESFFTHKVKYIIGSRTEETYIQGKMTADKNTFEFDILGTEISGNITSKTPGKNITITVLCPHLEPESYEGTELGFSANVE